MKDEDTPSSAYYTANGAGLSGLKLMGLMATARAPFPEHASITSEEVDTQQQDGMISPPDTKEQSALTTAKKPPPKRTPRTSPNKLQTKQLPISPLAIEHL